MNKNELSNIYKGESHGKEYSYGLVNYPIALKPKQKQIILWLWALQTSGNVFVGNFDSQLSDPANCVFSFKLSTPIKNLLNFQIKSINMSPFIDKYLFSSLGIPSVYIISKA